MKLIKGIFFLLFICAIVGYANSECVGPHPEQDLMETGIIKLQQSGNKYGLTTYSLTPKYQVPIKGFQVALSLVNHDFESPSGYNFFIKGKQKKSTLQVSLTVAKDIKWSFVEVSYLLTSRNDLYAGSFLTDEFDVNIYDNSTSNHFSIKNAIPKDSQYISKVFICGVDIKDQKNDFDLKNLQSTYNPETEILAILGSVNSLSLIRSLRISYIVYKKAAEFLITETPKSADYNFKYTSAFENGKSNALTLKFDFDRYNCIGRKCQSSCVKSSQCATGVIVQNSCFKCGKKEVILKGACVPACKINQDYDVENDACICKPGFAREIPESQCKWTCKFNQIWKNGCVCKQNWYKSISKKQCKPMPECPTGSKFNIETEQCQCMLPSQKLSNGICRPPGKFQTYDNEKKVYVCISGYQYYSGSKCRQICTEYQDQLNDGCVCKPNCYKDGQLCIPCPEKSLPSADKSSCICSTGLTFDSKGNCVPILEKCPQGTKRQPNGVCSCKEGQYLDKTSNICKPIPKCPQKSKWVQSKLKCLCITIGQNMIDNKCQSCKANEFWNGKQCACTAGLNKIDGVCVACAANASFKDNECQCNYGFFGNGRVSCKKCHQNCGKCVGEAADQCLVCAEASMKFTKKNGKQIGSCSKSGCPPGYYQKKDLPKMLEDSCSPCSTYCAQCNSQQICNKCIPGFEEYNYYEGNVLTFSYCTEICGDGKRFENECDDGNQIQGDGCSEVCEIESGFICEGGSSIQADICTLRGSTGSVLTLTGTLTMSGKIMQGARISNLPAILTERGCEKCSELLWPRIVSASVIPKVQISYVQNSKYQFMITFDFGSMRSIPVFTISIQINPNYAHYFTESDLSQIQIKKIDPAVLAIASDETELKIDLFT